MEPTSADLAQLLAPLGAGVPLLMWAWGKAAPLLALLERRVVAEERAAVAAERSAVALETIAAELPAIRAQLEVSARPDLAERLDLLRNLYAGAPPDTRDRAALRAVLDLDPTEAPDPPRGARVVQHSAGR